MKDLQTLNQYSEFTGSRKYVPLILRCEWREYKIFKINNTFKIREYQLQYSEGEIIKRIMLFKKPLYIDGSVNLINYLMGEIETEYIDGLDDEINVEMHFKFIFDDIYESNKYYCYTEDPEDAKKQLSSIKKKLTYTVKQLGKIYITDK
jgi:hypothetical protein